MSQSLFTDSGMELELRKDYLHEVLSACECRWDTKRITDALGFPIRQILALTPWLAWARLRYLAYPKSEIDFVRILCGGERRADSDMPQHSRWKQEHCLDGGRMAAVTRPWWSQWNVGLGDCWLGWPPSEIIRIFDELGMRVLSGDQVIVDSFEIVFGWMSFATFALHADCSPLKSTTTWLVDATWTADWLKSHPMSPDSTFTCRYIYSDYRVSSEVIFHNDIIIHHPSVALSFCAWL